MAGLYEDFAPSERACKLWKMSGSVSSSRLRYREALRTGAVLLCRMSDTRNSRATCRTQLQHASATLHGGHHMPCDTSTWTPNSAVGVEHGKKLKTQCPAGYQVARKACRADSCHNLLLLLQNELASAANQHRKLVCADARLGGDRRLLQRQRIRQDLHHLRGAFRIVQREHHGGADVGALGAEAAQKVLETVPLQLRQRPVLVLAMMRSMLIGLC